MTVIILRGDGQRQEAISQIAALDLSRPWEVTIAPYRRRRTLSQNALMWTWIHRVAAAVSDHTGMDADDVHEFFKHKFLTPKIIEIGGETVERYSTRDKSTAEMSAYMERIYAFCAGLGVVLPTPDEYMRDANGRAT